MARCALSDDGGTAIRPARLRVLYLHQYFQTRADYGITRSYELAKHLVDQGHQVTMITGNRSYQSGSVLGGRKGGWLRSYTVDGIRVLSVEVFLSYRRSFVHRAGAFAAYSLLSLWAGLRSGPADVVLATSPPLTAGLAGIVLMVLKRARFVFEVRDLWPEVIEELGVVRWRPAIAVLGLMARLNYRSATRVVAVTPGIQRWLIERRGVPATKVELVTQGADVDLFVGVEREVARAELGLGDAFVAVYAGAMGKANDLGVVVEAAAQLRRDTQFLLIGEGMEKARLQQMCDRLGASNVRLLPGQLRRDVVHYLVAADVGLVSLKPLPVFRTALPNKLFDYAAAGLPIVVTFSGDLAEFVEQEKIGVGAGDGDAARLALAVEALRNNPELRRAMGARARALAQTRLARAHQCVRFEQVLRRAASRGGVH